MSDISIYDRIRADIDLDAVKTNTENLKKNLRPGTKVCAVVKADGYGHGAVPVAKKIKDIVDFFAVATFDEAANLKNHDINNPILILGYIHTNYTMFCVRNDFRITVYDLEAAKKINEFARDLNENPVKVHIKIDTGMSRIGFVPCEENLDKIRQICEMDFIEAEGIYTHLHSADCRDTESAKRQLEIFLKTCEKLESGGLEFRIKHCSNSAAATVLPEANLDMVRLGISLYGLYPSENVRAVELKNAMSLISHVSFVKTVRKGETIGYGASYTAPRDMLVATIPAGYADGFRHGLSNKGYVLIRGLRAPVVGEVCMNQFMVDVTDIEGATEGDEVVIVGKSGGNTITMEELSDLSGSFNYEFACDIAKRVPRVFYSDGEIICEKDYFYDKYTPKNKYEGMVHAH